MDVAERLIELGIILPEPPPRAGIYKPAVRVGNLVYISGQGSTEHGLPVVTGKVGKDRTIEEGQLACRICTLNALSVLNREFGNLEGVNRVIKTLAFIASAEGFNQQPKVANGASQLLQDIFGENGVGARSAIGMYELPDNITAEVEFIFEMKE